MHLNPSANQTKIIENQINEFENGSLFKSPQSWSRDFKGKDFKSFTTNKSISTNELSDKKIGSTQESEIYGKDLSPKSTVTANINNLASTKKFESDLWDKSIGNQNINLLNYTTITTADNSDSIAIDKKLESKDILEYTNHSTVKDNKSGKSL